jgi:hypothetical protein
MLFVMTSRVQLIPALLDHPLSELASYVHFMAGVPHTLPAPLQ